VLLLGEVMTMRKWVGLLLGFAGILIIARPDAASFNWGVVMILGAATGFSCCGVIIRTLAQSHEPASRIAFVTLCLMAVFSLPLALTHWQTPRWEHLPYLAILGLGSASCQFCVGKALQHVNLSTVQPFTFLTLIWSSIVGFIWFDETVAWSAIVGAGCIITGVIYSVRRPRRNTEILPGTHAAS
jgi:drug/metabolite transporter (DMT)-like permease